MADELKQIQEVENKIKAIYARIGKEVPAKLLDNKSIEDANTSLSMARSLLSDLEGTATNLYEQLKGISSEFKGQRTSINESRSSLRKLTDISRELKLNEEGINQLSSQQIKSLTRKFDIQKSIFDESQQERTDEILARKDIDEQIKSFGGYVAESLELIKDITDEERALLYLRYAQEDPIQKISDRLKEAAKFENEITSAVGLTGAAFDNLNKIGVRAFGGLGINLGTLQEGFESANEAMRAQAIKDMNSELSTFQKRVNTLKAGAKALGPILTDVFTDPLILSKALVDAFFDLNKAGVALSRETGQGIGNFDSLNTRAATTVDLMEVIVEASKETGLNIQNVFSADVLAGAAEFKRTMGGTAEEASGLLDLTAATGMTTDAILESTVETVNAFNGANKAAISQRGVMRDVLSASTAVKASLAGNPKALAEAAAAARRLGLSLQEVDSIADSLLDFESSINNELEAQLLTGRSINLAKARELALNNDITGLSNEIFKNQVSVAEFSRMNRIQQDALAKSLGINRDQLAKMAFQQAKLNGLTAEQAAAAAGVSLEDMKSIEIQENFQMALQKTLQVFEPLLKIVSNFLSVPFVPQLLLWGTIGAKVFSGIGKGIFGADKSLTSFIKKITGLEKIQAKLAASKTLQSVYGVTPPKTKALSQKQLLAGFGGKEAMEAAKAQTATLQKGTDKVKEFQKVTSKAGKASPAAGTGISMFFTNLGVGLTSFAQAMAAPTPIGPVGAVAAAALLALSLAMIGLGFALKLAAPGIKAFGTVITSVFQGVGHLITTTAEAIQNLMSTLTLGQIGTLAAAAASFFALGSALAFLGTAGLIGLPVLVSLTPILLGVGAAAGLGASIGAGTAEGENSMAKVEEKLDKLISIVEKGGKVYLDGNLVGTYLSLGTVKSA